MTQDSIAANEAMGQQVRPVDVMRWFYRYKWFLLACAVGMGTVAALYSLTLARTYQASALLRPVVAPNIAPSGSSLGGALGGALGGLAGAVLGPGQMVASDATVTVTYMKSMDFARAFLQHENLLPEFYPGRWDAAHKTWKGPPPPLDDAARNFLARITVEQQVDGLVKLDVLWGRPREAVAIAQKLIAQVNQWRQEQALRRSSRNLGYLENRLRAEPVQEMRLTIANLASTELTRIMLAQGPGDYALETVSPPYAPEYAFAPQRKLYALVGAVFGFAAGAMFLLIRQALRGTK